MWRQLTGLLRPGALGGRMRLLTWELHAAHEHVHAGLWVPATINPVHVANTVTGAYPRARTKLGPTGAASGPGLPAPWPAPPSLTQQAREFLAARRGRPAPPRRPASVGYLLVPRTSMWLPLLVGAPSGSGRTSPRTARSSPSTGAPDALGMLCQGLADIPKGYRATVQILARPLPAATRSTAARVTRSGGMPPKVGVLPRAALTLIGLIESVLGETLSLVTPGPTPRTRSIPPSSHRDAEWLDPATRQQQREAATKAASELVEICVRITVSGPNRTRCRERAWELANGLRAVITAQGTNTIRLPHPEPTVSTRSRSNWRAAGLRLSSRAGHRRGWFVATDSEVGALARLPHHPALFRFDVARAPHLPAPVDVPRMRQLIDESGPVLHPVDEAVDSLPERAVDQPIEDYDERGFEEDLFDQQEKEPQDDGEERPDRSWEGWDDDFPDLYWNSDGDQDGDDPEDGYRGEAA
jgi:hypothetical protein